MTDLVVMAHVGESCMSQNIQLWSYDFKNPSQPVQSTSATTTSPTSSLAPLDMYPGPRSWRLNSLKLSHRFVSLFFSTTDNSLKSVCLTYSSRCTSIKLWDLQKTDKKLNIINNIQSSRGWDILIFFFLSICCKNISYYTLHAWKMPPIF